MERESFEDEEIASILNNHFIAIKVDREERPDIDHIYMTVCQHLTGSGGWPLSIFMTPDAKPFYAGTYFPKNNRMGMPGMITILEQIKDVWKKNKNILIDSSEEVLKTVNLLSNERGYNKEQEEGTEILDINTIHEAFSQYKRSFDSIYGGFGNAPKFPTPHNLFFLLRYWYITKEPFALRIVEKTLDSIYKGGIYDHIGFGFSRYSTDRKWLVPHFEKMLYDNALLAIAYLEVYQATHSHKYGRISKEIFTYILRDMTSSEGGFFCAEDADSEGEEGKFYVWSIDELENVLGKADSEIFCAYYGITEQGNFEGKNIPNLLKETIINSDTTDNNVELIKKLRGKLFDYRQNRVHPHKDDKILTSWNGLMIAALAIGGRVLGEEQYVYAAERAANFIFKNLIREDGRLLARYRDGNASFPAYVDDYAFFIWGLIELYETTYNPHYLEKALGLNDDLFKFFWDEENGGLFVYGSDSEQLITRPKEIYDGATPSGNSVSALNFLRLAKLTGIYELEVKANQLLNIFTADIQAYPTSHSFALIALMFMISSTKEVVIVNDWETHEFNKMINIINEKFRPFLTSIVCTNEHESIRHIAPFISNYKTIEGKPTAYICENFSCKAPVTDIGKFKDLLEE